MKIKSLLLGALVACSCLCANAITQYTGCTDFLSADDLTLEPGESATITLMLNRVNTPDFTNIQCDIVFPVGIRPIANAKGKYVTSGTDTRDEDGSIVNFSDNFKNTDVYPNHRVIGFNLTKTAIYPNPCNMINIFVKADQDLLDGDYDLMFHSLKYTCYNNDSYASYFPDRGEAPQKVCTITVKSPSTGVNDLNVEKSNTYKTIENGQVVIVKNGVKYNTMGQAL